MNLRAAMKGQFWRRVGPRLLPFADVATAEVSLGRLLRLSLFQVSVGMVTALLVGTLNRVMIVELGVSASLVALMVALPLVFAPLRAAIGLRSDHHRSALGWRRVPYIWKGSMLQFGGFAIMPFSLLLLGEPNEAAPWIGHVGAAAAFLAVGAGLHVTQTAGLALASDLSTEENRPRVVALMYVMLLVGLAGGGLGFGVLLTDFTQIKLIQVVQGVAVATIGLNLVATWKQEARDPARGLNPPPAPAFMTVWRRFTAESRARRFLLSVALGAAAFGMQDVVLEPYGAEVLKLSVASTTMLTAIVAGGSLAAFGIAARLLQRGHDAPRLAAMGLLVGVGGFTLIILSSLLQSAAVFRIGAALVGFGGGLFSVGTLVAAMTFDRSVGNGFALGAWGAVQATAAGLAIALGGVIRDAAAGLAASGALGPVVQGPAFGYTVVYHLEILFLFIALAAIGPLAGYRAAAAAEPFGLPEFPN